MTKGFVMLSRELLEGELYFSERFTRSQAYIDLCMLAAYRERSFFIRGNKITLKPGQLAKSEEDLAERWKWSRNTVRKFLNEQQECGNIEQQKSRLITIISVKFGIDFKQQNEQQDGVDCEQQIKHQNEQQIEQLTRIIEEYSKEIEQLKKEKEELANASKKKRGKVELDFSIVSPEFIDVVNDWLEYKKERGESYKPKGFSSFYKKLLELSNNNADKAQKIIEQSKSNNYAGIFPLKETKKYGFVEYTSEKGRYDEAKKWVAEFQK